MYSFSYFCSERINWACAVGAWVVAAMVSVAHAAEVRIPWPAVDSTIATDRTAYPRRLPFIGRDNRVFPNVSTESGSSEVLDVTRKPTAEMLTDVPRRGSDGRPPATTLTSDPHSEGNIFTGAPPPTSSGFTTGPPPWADDLELDEKEPTVYEKAIDQRSPENTTQLARPDVNSEASIDPGILESAQIVAEVGNQTILAGDLLGMIDQLLARYKGKIPDEEYQRQRRLALQQILPRAIETKLAYLAFVRAVPEEKFPDIEKQISERFEEVRLPKLMKQAELGSVAELEIHLRQQSSSLEKQRRAFVEQVMAVEALRQKINVNQEVTHDEMLSYYRDNAEEFAIRARATWQHLMTRFSRHPSREAAWRSLADMGNEVIGGAPLAAVAKRSSQGIDSEEGGLNDWTDQGSLASDVLDQAIFNIPVGRLSDILEDSKGFHIVRVVQRQTAARVPFREAQVQIKKKIRQQRREFAQKDYVQKLKETTSVWTIFDEPADLSSQVKTANSDSEFLR